MGKILNILFILTLLIVWIASIVFFNILGFIIMAPVLLVVYFVTHLAIGILKPIVKAMLKK